MSKLIERLKKANQTSAPRMGFGSARQELKPIPTALVALMRKADSKLLSSLKEAGVDGCILTVEAERDLAKYHEAIKDLSPFPLGLWLRYEGAEKSQALEGTWDFLVLSTSSSPGCLIANEGYKKVLQIDFPMEEGAIRVIEQLPVEAVLLDRGKEQILNIAGLLTLHRLAQLIRKPLIVKSPVITSDKELHGLRDSGIAGIAVEVSDQSGVDSLKGMRQTLEALPPRQRREERGEALLPRIARSPQEAPHRHSPEPEEEPDEDDY